MQTRGTRVGRAVDVEAPAVAGRGGPHRGRRRKRRFLVAALLPVLVLLAAGAFYLSLLSTAQDPYGVGRLALAQFHRQYARAIPLSVRVADSALGWIGVCEGVALLDGERVPQAVLRPDGSLYLARFGAGHGLWIVETAVVRQEPAHQVRPAPLPPWRQLLPFGPDRPLLGSLR